MLGAVQKTEQKGDLCSQRQVAALRERFRCEHKEIIRVFGVIGTRCLTADRCLLVYAVVSVEETEILDIKVVTAVCLKKLFKPIFGEVVFINIICSL